MMSPMRYKTETEIAEVVRGFEETTISRDEWRHAEHLTLALHYLTLYDYETATQQMRQGIFRLLKSFGVDLTNEMPYHETLTVFWMKSVNEFNKDNESSSLFDKANNLIANHDKDLPLKFYTREHLFSDKARAQFVEPDIVNLS